MSELTLFQYREKNPFLWAGLEVVLLPILKQWLLEHTPANSFDPIEVAIMDTGIDLSALMYKVTSDRAQGVQPRNDPNEAEKMADDCLEIINDFLGTAGRVNAKLAFQVFDVLMRQAEKEVLKDISGRN